MDTSMLADLCETLPSHEREGQVFWKLRLSLGKSHIQYLLSRARLRTSLVIILSLFFWLGLFVLFYAGFEFVISHVGSPGAYYHAQTVQFVFALFFASLQVMLIFSSGIILYSGLYASRETEYLMTMPVRDERIVFFRFQEALFFSSWGFFLLASPMMVAYGIVVHAPWYYYVYLPAMMISFAYIPCSIGSILCLLLISRLPRLRRILVGLMALVIIGVAYQSIWQTLDMAKVDVLGTSWFRETYYRFSITRGEWLPSTWLSNGLLDAARHTTNIPDDLPWLESGKYLIVLLSNALMLHVAVNWFGKRLFRNSYNGLHNRTGYRAPSKLSWIYNLPLAIMKIFPRQTQLLISKDLRLFRRDPVQWSQFLIFIGLLLLYFVNVDRFRQHKTDVNVLTWVNIVSFLNLAVVGLILSTFTTRFIYPLISLEGRRFWVLSLLPVNRDTILWSKFIFAACGSWFPCSLLVLISDWMLNVNGMVIGVHQFICLLLCLGLAGMAVGLGAIMPNFHEQSPSKIAAGFGGTLNLVLSALYIMAVVLMTAMPCHFYLLASTAGVSIQWAQPQVLRVWMGVGMAGSLVLALLVTAIPLQYGLKAFRQLEV